MKKNALVLICFLCATTNVYADEMRDEDVAFLVTDAQACRHADARRAALNHLMKSIDYDTNRFVRVVGRMLGDETKRIGLLSILQRYGNKSALPIFYKHLSDSNCLYYAAWGVLAHEGLTSNSVMKISEQIQRFKDTQSAYNAFGVMMNYASKEKDLNIRRLAVNEGIAYATKNQDCTEIVDKLLMEADETYRLSKRRLNVLRSVKAIGLTKWNKEFVEKVIKELEAFPEEKLPE